jgi:hypothetical protein
MTEFSEKESGISVNSLSKYRLSPYISEFVDAKISWCTVGAKGFNFAGIPESAVIVKSHFEEESQDDSDFSELKTHGTSDWNKPPYVRYPLLFRVTSSGLNKSIYFGLWHGESVSGMGGLEGGAKSVLAGGCTVRTGGPSSYSPGEAAGYWKHRAHHFPMTDLIVPGEDQGQLLFELVSALPDDPLDYWAQPLLPGSEREAAALTIHLPYYALLSVIDFRAATTFCM